MTEEQQAELAETARIAEENKRWEAANNNQSKMYEEMCSEAINNHAENERLRELMKTTLDDLSDGRIEEAEHRLLKAIHTENAEGRVKE